MISKKVFLKDFSLNLAASLLLTGIIQLIIYPLIGRRVGNEVFGDILILLGIINMVSNMIGSSLNNIRLIERESGFLNFGVLLKKSIILVIFLSFFLSFIVLGEKIFIYNILCIIVITVLTMIRIYSVVYYRITLSYNKILLNNIVLLFGNLIGLYIFGLTENWYIIFILGEIFSIVYIYWTSDIKKESLEKDNKFEEIHIKWKQLILSNSITNIMMYLDRIIISPIIGSENVTIYFVASLVGKIIGIVFQPVSSIILSYITKNKENNGRKIFKMTLISVLVVGVIAYLLTIIFSPLIIRLLYSDLFVEASKYFYIANLASIFMIMGGLIQPVILKFCPMFTQKWIQISYMISYICFSFPLMKIMGLKGFCIAAVLANLIRLITTIGVGYYYIIKLDDLKKVRK